MSVSNILQVFLTIVMKDGKKIFTHYLMQDS
jgi:hypothetical protein